MNEGRMLKFLRVGLLSLTLLGMATPLAAQNANDNTNRTADTRDDRREVRRANNDDDDRDWGWLGLLGLAGLLGLMPKKKREVHVRETNDVRDRNANDRR